MLLGCIADDLTGATDVANMLVRAGMRTVQTIGVPRASMTIDADAVVVALKSRTIEPQAAVEQSLAALTWLRERKARQILFKYCSTFDSTDRGNIGPVADALLDALGSSLTIACPAFPENRRTIYNGHLFVGDQLLSDSPMRDHPLTPMRDANLVRVLSRQVRRKVGLVALPVVEQGTEAIRDALSRLEANGFGFAIVDAVADRDLIAIGAACAELPLVTGGSGIALGLPQNFSDARLRRDAAPPLPAAGGLSAVLAGSCSSATQGQVAAWTSHHPAIAMQPRPDDTPGTLAARCLQAADEFLSQGRPFLVYSTTSPDAVAATQQALGRERAAELIESAFGKIARELVTRGVHRFVVAGGETSGAVVQALGVDALRIGPQIDPGVPWTESLSQPRLALALKSGNFGSVDFFAKALAMLPS